MQPRHRPITHCVRLVVGLLALAVWARPPAAANAAPASSAPDPGEAAAWWTFARGDEALAAAIHPIDGRVWVGTEGGGVVVWDAAARSFEHYLFPNQPGLRSNTVYDIAFDARSGDAWLATADGLTHVARSTGWWTTYLHPSLLPQPPSIDVAAVEELPPLRVWSAVAVAPDGTLWAGIPQADRALDTSDSRALRDLAPDGGVVRRTPDGRWTAFPFHPHSAVGPARSTVADLAVLPDGRLVVAHGRRGNTEFALSIYDPHSDAWSAVRSVGPIGAVADGPRSGQVMQLAVAAEADGGFSLWLATWSRGVYRWRDGRWTAFSRSDEGKDIAAAPGLCSDQVWAISAASDAVWAACVGRSSEEGLGVSRFDRATETWQPMGVADGLPTGVVTAIAAHPGGAILGTDEPTARHGGGIGLVPVRAGANGLEALPPLSTADGGRTPAANEVTALTFDSGGRLWAGTRGAGLLGWDPMDGTWRQWTTASTAGGLAGDAVSDLLVVEDELWIASTRSRHAAQGPSDGGITVLDRASGTVVRAMKPDTTGLPSGQPSSLALGADGRIHVGFGAATGGVGIDVQQGNGVAAFDPATGVWTAWRRREGALGGDTVLDLARGAEGVWAAVSYAPDGTSAARLTGGGVGLLLGSAWQFWRSGDFGLASYKDGAITGDVRSIAEAADGSIWAGTYALDGEIAGQWPVVDAVANRYDPQRRQWRSAVFPGDGWIAAIVDDDDGQIWLATTRGHSGEIWRADEVRGDRDLLADRRDPARGGIWIGAGINGPWTRIAPDSSGLAGRSITALAVEPATGHVWVGLSGGGIAVFTGGERFGPTDPGRPVGRDRSRLPFRAWLPSAQR